MGKMNIQENKMPESGVVHYFKSQIEYVTGLKCEVVPQSDTWYDGFCLDTGNLGLHFFLFDDLEDRLKEVKEHIENHKNGKVPILMIPLDPETGKRKEIDYSTIKLIHNGVGRNISRFGISPSQLPFEEESMETYFQLTEEV